MENGHSWVPRGVKPGTKPKYHRFYKQGSCQKAKFTQNTKDNTKATAQQNRNGNMRIRFTHSSKTGKEKV